MVMRETECVGSRLLAPLLKKLTVQTARLEFINVARSSSIFVVCLL